MKLSHLLFAASHFRVNELRTRSYRYYTCDFIARFIAQPYRATKSVRHFTTLMCSNVCRLHAQTRLLSHFSLFHGLPDGHILSALILSHMFFFFERLRFLFMLQLTKTDQKTKLLAGIYGLSKAAARPQVTCLKASKCSNSIGFDLLSVFCLAHFS